MRSTLRKQHLSALAAASLVLSTGSTTALAAGTSIKVAAETVEGATEPIGIALTAPRLGWQLTASGRGQAQTAYQVVVASSRKLADQGHGDIWDSGKISTTQSADVPYAGPALKSGRRYFWRVRVWDAQHNRSAWGKVATFETGLAAADWKASWIGSPASAPGFSGAHWIWYPEGDPTVTEPVETRYFRRTFDLGTGAVTSAMFSLTADDRFTLYVNGTKIGSSPQVTDSWKQGQLFDVTSALHQGTNTIAIEATNTSVSPAGVLGHLHVERAGTTAADLITDGSFKAAQTVPTGWEQPTFDDSAWPAAKDTVPYGQGPWGTNVSQPSPPVPYLRHGFQVSKPVAAARLYISALGLYEARINGRRVGDDHFAPGWTDYNKRVQYATYDVTGLLHPGGNAIGALLGNGWYSGQIGFAGSHIYGQQPWLSAQLRIDYTDGTSEAVTTDPTWKTASSPLLSSDIYAGETYDARNEQAGWDTSAFDDHAWQPAKVNTSENANLVPVAEPPVRVDTVLHPVKMTQPKPGVFIFDMGQNMVGWNRLTVTGPAGTTVTLRNGEVLNPDGTLYTANLRSAIDTDHYTLKGVQGGETYEPHFTYRGYRYVEVTGYPGTPDLSSIAGVVAHADAPATGSLTTSNPLINQIQHNIVWGQKGNFFSVPTDCPQRDERLGWTGDIAAFAATSTFNMNADSFLAKFTTDLADDQTADGAFTDVAPAVISGSGTAGWGDAGVILPYTLWQRYGDLQVVRDRYPAMKKWISYLQAHSSGLIRPDQGYGDWLNVNDQTPKGLIGTAYFAHSTDLLAQMADAIGDHSAAASYRTLWGQIRDAFDAKYVSADGTVGSGSQTGYVLAISFNLLPNGQITGAADKLVANVAAHQGHLTTGFLGTGNLLPVLTSTGHNDVAYRLLEQTTFPSWGYQISKGATTIWERWDGIKPDGTFNDPGMNSFNHYGLGSVGDWMYQNVGGISPAAPGYQRILIHPLPGGSLTWAKESYQTPYGAVQSSWTQSGGRLTLTVTVPVNTTAEVWMPDAHSVPVTQDGAHFLRMQSGNAVFSVGSGTWHFTSPS